jgi:hypothetical protein
MSVIVTPANLQFPLMGLADRSSQMFGQLFFGGFDLQIVTDPFHQDDPLQRVFGHGLGLFVLEQVADLLLVLPEVSAAQYHEAFGVALLNLAAGGADHFLGRTFPLQRLGLARIQIPTLFAIYRSAGFAQGGFFQPRFTKIGVGTGFYPTTLVTGAESCVFPHGCPLSGKSSLPLLEV